MDDLDKLFQELSKNPEFLAEYKRLKPGYDKLVQLIKESSKQNRVIEIQEDDDETIIVSDSTTLVYGVGNDLEKAIDDYLISLEA